MTDSAARLECSVCQGEMLSKDGQAFCPVCLMKQGMHASSMGGFAAMRDWKPPAVEELVNRFPSLEIESLIGQGAMRVLSSKVDVSELVEVSTNREICLARCGSIN